MSGNVVCDLDGVVYRGSREIQGAGSALRRLSEAEFLVLFCTNNSSRTEEEVAEKIHRVTGYPALPEHVLGSAAAAAALLSADRPPTYYMGGNGIARALHRVGIEVVESERAEAVVVGVDFDLTYQRLRDAATAVARGARFVATNSDPTYPAEDGFWPGAGSMLAAVETASGRTAEVAGKPYRPMRDLIRTHLQPGPVWVVGDRPDTDLALADAESEWRSVLVLTGVISNPASVNPGPDLVAADLEQAARLILAQVSG